MQKIELTKKVIIELFVIAGLFLVLLFFAVSQKVAIGQKYQQVYFNGELVGNIAGHVSVDDAVHEVRRELAAESDEPLCMDYEYSSSKANDWFTPLMTEDALKEALKEKMKVSEIETQVRAYTVAIEGYRGNFKSMDEVTEFLNTVKNEADTEGQYTTQISKEAGHISGIYTAQLTEVDPKENTEVTPEVTLADQVSAGANGAFTYQMEYAMANPRDDSYETGTIGMEFIERVEVYEKYISGDALSDVETQVEEVTKEKETNKIYVVESGDVLSVIAMDHDTTVANIMALNGFDNAEAHKEATIREAEGQAEAILKIQQANADGLRMLKEAAPDAGVLQLKSLEAFAKAADGKATKIIIPSEIQGIAGLAKSVVEVGKEN